MQAALDEDILGRVLPGSWTIAATNVPAWLNGERTHPHLTWELLSQSPLVLSDELSYLDAAGEEKSLVGTATWNWEEFRWRGKGLQRFVSSRWSVSGLSPDGSIAVLHFVKSRLTPDGIDIIVRDGAQVPELRATIAAATEDYGLTPEDFGSLTWLVPAASAPPAFP